MPSSPLGNHDLIRAINRSIILNMIKSSGPISRAAIARLSGLSPATVTGITADLIATNLVLEKAAGDSSGGRPPILLALNPLGGYVIGIKITENQVIGALTDLMATVVTKQTLPLSNRTIEAVIDALAELVSKLLRRGKVQRKQLRGVGIGIAGVVDQESGILHQSPYFGWTNLPLRDLIQERLHTPVYVDNDVNTLTLSEKWFGLGQNVEDFITVTVGRGLGMGIVVNGQLYRGKSGGAGEFGHTVVVPDGELCACGRRGCLETYVSDQGLLRSAARAAESGNLLAPVATSTDLARLAEAGDPAAQQILAEAGSLLGTHIANLINLLDPEIVILSGEGTRYGDWFFRAVRETASQHVMPGMAGVAQIQIDDWGDDAWALGAASLVLGELFESPVYHEEITTAG